MISILHRRTTSSDSPDNKANTKWWVATTHPFLSGGPFTIVNMTDLLKNQRKKLLLGPERKSVCPKVHSLFLCPFRSFLFYLRARLATVCVGSSHCVPVAVFPSALSATSSASSPGLSVFLFSNCISGRIQVLLNHLTQESILVAFSLLPCVPLYLEGFVHL